MSYGNHYGETKIEPKINWLCVLGNLETSIKVVLYGHTLKVPEPSQEWSDFYCTSRITRFRQLHSNPVIQ
jgi:hypothetical protein